MTAPIDPARAEAHARHNVAGQGTVVATSVVAALLHKAIGEKLTCVFVDTGLLRWQEGDQVMAMFGEHMGVKVVRVNAADRYFARLKGVNDPEAKRKIIGNLFVEIFDEESNKLKNAKWLAQGTIYPDVIESAGSKTGKAHVIKSHHNVGGLPEQLGLKLLEMELEGLARHSSIHAAGVVHHPASAAKAVDTTGAACLASGPA